jgi:hypothetical protein
MYQKKSPNFEEGEPKRILSKGETKKKLRE